MERETLTHVRYEWGALPWPHHHPQALPGWLRAKLHCLSASSLQQLSSPLCSLTVDIFMQAHRIQSALSWKAKLTNAMNGSMICTLFGSSVDWSTPSTSLITMNNPEMAGCSSPDSYVIRIRSNNKNSLSSWLSLALRLPQHLFFYPQPWSWDKST